MANDKEHITVSIGIALLLMYIYNDSLYDICHYVTYSFNPSGVFSSPLMMLLIDISKKVTYSFGLCIVIVASALTYNMTMTTTTTTDTRAKLAQKVANSPQFMIWIDFLFSKWWMVDLNDLRQLPVVFSLSLKRH
jgi:hypothetical protein